MHFAINQTRPKKIVKNDAMPHGSISAVPPSASQTPSRLSYKLPCRETDQSSGSGLRTFIKYTMAITAPGPSGPFKFPKIHADYPPFFSLQPTASSRQAQLEKWSRLIQRYCRHYKIFQLSIVDYQDKDLFKNTRSNKSLPADDIKRVIDFMVSKDGQQRAEWVTPAKASAWIYWRRPEEWANSIAAWVEDTGQKGSVLTLYEIVEGDATENEEFHGMDLEILRKGLSVLSKQGKAQVFGTDDQQGVKFF